MEPTKQKAGRLFMPQYNFVLGLACHYAPFPGIADDIANEVFTKFVENADRWDLNGDIRPILVRLARITAARHWRERVKMFPNSLQKIAEHVRSVAEHNARQADEPGNENEIFALRKCLNRLKPKSFRIIELRYEKKIPTAEIAKHLVSSDAAVRQAMCRIRGQLRKCIRRVLEENES